MEKGAYNMNTENSKSRITETSIGGTVYIVESLVSDNAKETAYTKVKRLIKQFQRPYKVIRNNTIIIAKRLHFSEIVR